MIIFCYIIGAIFAIVGLITLIKDLHDKKVCTQEKAATIVEYEIKVQHGDSDEAPHNTYFPVFSFYADGREIRKVGNVGYTYQKYNVGTEMDILYDPENPEHFIVPSNKKTIYAVSAICLLIGLGLIVVTILRQMGILNI